MAVQAVEKAELSKKACEQKEGCLWMMEIINKEQKGFFARRPGKWPRGLVSPKVVRLKMIWRGPWRRRSSCNSRTRT